MNQGWTGGGFEDIFRSLANLGQPDQWKAWAWAVRAKRLYVEGREHLVEEVAKKNNMTVEQVFAEMLAPGMANPEFQKVFDRWQAFNQSILDVAEATGVINAEQKSLWAHADYVPFYRVFDDLLDGNTEVSGPGRKCGVANRRSGIRQLKGGTAQINDLIEKMACEQAAR